MADRSPDEILASAIESSRNIKFGRGVVSKTSYVAALVVAVWLMIAWRWTDNIAADTGLMVAGLVVTGFAVWYIKASQSFAEHNPSLALLEGAELLEWQRQEMVAKGLPPMPNAPLIEDRGGPAREKEVP